ncbi:hypothetical protein ScPMuIL_006353 [Solemya velum]
MSAYEGVGGSLKLKGVSEHKIKKKKKKKDKEKAVMVYDHLSSNTQSLDEENSTSKDIKKRVDKRTKAEIAYDKQTEKRQELAILEKAAKTHKERIMDFNRHLDTLTEHFDIPKVSWTK